MENSAARKGNVSGGPVDCYICMSSSTLSEATRSYRYSHSSSRSYDSEEKMQCLVLGLRHTSCGLWCVVCPSPNMQAAGDAEVSCDTRARRNYHMIYTSMILPLPPLLLLLLLVLLWSIRISSFNPRAGGGSCSACCRFFVCVVFMPYVYVRNTYS